jgi:hypothetical protein
MRSLSSSQPTSTQRPVPGRQAALILTIGALKFPESAEDYAEVDPMLERRRPTNLCAPATPFDRAQPDRTPDIDITVDGKLHNVYPFRRLAVCDRCGANLCGEAHRAAAGRAPVLYMACTTQREQRDCHHIEPDKGYWRNQRRNPGRWPGCQETG